ncbi:MAG: bifunctional 3,4-dihydroxy-2-butanone-4-phosphate synthase/GTP cyclohydrolase II [Candidatus Omnitrophota bacterium]
MFNSVQEALEDLKNGKKIIVIDDEDRENEGDLIIAGSLVKPDDINFMAKYGRGLVCVPMEGSRLDRLNLQPMVSRVKDPFKTNWAVSCDAATGITTGISANDRARTINILADLNSHPDDLIRPGHVFPLRSQDGGVLVRAGHTEACTDLLKIAGLDPVGVICEIMKDDGSMARASDLLEFSKKHGLKICAIASIIEYRRKLEKLIRRVAEVKLPTKHGEFRMIAYESVVDNYHHLALIKGDIGKGQTLVRVHSQCITGDVFGSKRCDCGEQLEAAMARIEERGSGVILYMRQEGRGIGIDKKLKAYELQDLGMDTVEANEALGYKADLRDYGIGAQILVDLGVREIQLLTNNPQKIIGLEGYDMKVVERIPMVIEANDVNRRYLQTKKEKMGHYLDV